MDSIARRHLDYIHILDDGERERNRRLLRGPQSLRSAECLDRRGRSASGSDSGLWCPSPTPAAAGPTGAIAIAVAITITGMHVFAGTRDRLRTGWRWLEQRQRINNEHLRVDGCEQCRMDLRGVRCLGSRQRQRRIPVYRQYWRTAERNAD